MASKAKDKVKKCGGRKPTHSDDLVIHVVAKENPKRMGKKEKPFRSFKEWDWYTDGMTIGAYLKAHGSEKRANINYDVKHGFIRVTKPQSQQQAA